MKNRYKSAFTLSEVMVTLAVASIFGVAVMTFYIQSLKAGYTSQQQIALQSTMRTITSELISNASRSHEMILYRSSDAADRDNVDDRRLITLDANEDEVRPTGDMAVFAYYELPKPAAQNRHRVRKIIAYYPEQTDSGPPQLTRLVIDLSGAPSTSTVEQILANHWTNGGTGITVERKVFAPRVTPLALGDNYDPLTDSPRLFFMTSAENIAVCGQLKQSATNKDTSDRNTLTRTFFFTISVRA